jgi:hypothetical protein
MLVASLIFVLLLSHNESFSQSAEDGSLMGYVLNWVNNDMPGENSEGYSVPDSMQLVRWRRVSDLFIDGQLASVEDSLQTYFQNYEVLTLTDTLLSDSQWYVLREKTPIQLGWGTYVVNPNWQRDLTVSCPHPIFDTNTPQQSVDLLQFTGARLLAIAGTHRCSNSQASECDGTTSACSEAAQAFRVSDMAHVSNSAFQVVHEAILAESANNYSLNLHGHSNNSCEDVFLSNGRADDSKSTVISFRDSLISRGVDAAYAGDGSSCII